MAMLDAIEILQTYPPVEWGAYAESHSVEDIDELINSLEALCVQSARLSRYLTARKVFNFNHQEAVKFQNRKITQIRGALGFTTSRDDLSF